MRPEALLHDIRIMRFDVNDKVHWVRLAIPVKKTIYADQRRTPEVIQEREDWWAWISTLSVDDLYRLVFVDESCAKTNLTPLCGWSMKGGRCYGYAPCGRERYTMLSSIRPDGTSESIIFEKGPDKTTFKNFIGDVMPDALRPGDILIMDNARAHKIDFGCPEKKGIQVKSLPRYSPDLNPVEMMWSQIKAKLRKAKPGDFYSLWREYGNAHLEVTAEDAKGWYRGCGYFH